MEFQNYFYLKKFTEQFVLTSVSIRDYAKDIFAQIIITFLNFHAIHNMMSKQEFLTTGLLEKYALGLTSTEENDLVIGMLKKYPDLQTQCDGIYGCMEKYVDSQAIPPQPRINQKVENTINEYEMEKALKEAMEKPQSKGIVMSGWSLGVIAASLIGLLAFGWMNWNQKNINKTELSKLQNKFDQLQNDFSQFEEKQKAMAAQFAFLQDPLTTHIHLRDNNFGKASDALVVAYWNPNKENAYLKILNLPPPPTGKEYHLWGDVDKKMVHMGAIKCEIGKMLNIPHMVDAASLNITLEDKGDVHHPNVEEVYVNGVI